MNDLFASSSEAREFVKAVVENQSRMAGEPLTEFERQLLALQSNDLINSRISLAQKFGLVDSGRSSINRLTDLLRLSRKSKSMSEQHASGKTDDDLLRAAEQILDPVSDFSWLILRDSRHKPMTKLDSLFAKVIFVLLFAGFLIVLFWKAVRIGGLRLSVGLFILLAIAFLIDVIRRKAMQQQLPNSR